VGRKVTLPATFAMLLFLCAELACAGVSSVRASHGDVQASREQGAFPAIKDWNSIRIKLFRSPCLGTCPVYSIEVQGNGLVVFEGDEFVPVTGERHSWVSKQTIRKLVNAFQKADFFSLKDKYGAAVMDSPVCVISIEWDGKRKEICDYEGFTVGMPAAVTPAAVTRLEQQVDQLALQNDWIEPQIVGKPRQRR
jgi:hypothetical protein